MPKPFRYNHHKAKPQSLAVIINQIVTYKDRYGYDAPKYLHFIKDHLERGYKVSVYFGGKRGVSKYVFIENDTHLIKVRFSNHKPIKEYEEKEDCDFYVGISHKQVSTTADITKRINEMTMTKEIKQGKPIYLCHDEDCPACGFPETLDVCNDEMVLMRRICSKRCGWEISVEELEKLNK